MGAEVEVALMLSAHPVVYLITPPVVTSRVRSDLGGFHYVGKVQEAST